MQGAVLRECVVNLARVKEYVAQNVSGTLDTAGFDNWPELMRGIKAGLLMLGKTRAVEIIEEHHAAPEARDAARRHGAARPNISTGWPTPSSASSTTSRRCRPAAAIPGTCSTMRAACLEALARAPERVLPTVPPLPSAPHTRHRCASTLPTAARRRRAANAPTCAGWSRVGEPPVLAAAPSELRRDRDLPDPELTRLFIEEATEEVAKIQQRSRSGITIRSRARRCWPCGARFIRSRAAAAWSMRAHISEFAWAVENLLNRILDGTLQRSPAVLETLRAAVAADAAAGGRARSRARRPHRRVGSSSRARMPGQRPRAADRAAARRHERRPMARDPMRRRRAHARRSRRRRAALQRRRPQRTAVARPAGHGGVPRTPARS